MRPEISEATKKFLERTAPRKIIQITSMTPGIVMALCNDGTCWLGDMGMVNGKGETMRGGEWNKYDMDIPQDD